ncbi:hypothetical protein E3P89_02352 [Wallemia ichthyophaga]|uniref:ERCC1-like central domain-containing protein n=1 Tax=Wallemia ichthyophaga TaxID=245174 RepID=A0A4T0HCW0_WALIC|nr:hypothetical protein E3P90_03741 [Wallemia ichthyophaga]TIB12222.1 hypothetical protein E3P93_02373 [Wallemia ichthyophaga]TIB21929.1 hypothetical protein E3P89_02352 [Wallemia ichthyophaga]TIB23624.1 hypothetical protein E3P88_02443 [Wallemia ichthyophaga]
MRIERLGAMYQLRILLLMCDVADSEGSIKEVTKTCLINNMTVVIAWSPQQAGHYLSLYLQLDNKPPDSLKEKTPTDYQSIVNNALTTIKGVNKTDVYQLLTRFGSFKNIVKASPDELTKCPGFGDVKVRRMQEAFNYSLKVGVKGQQLSGKNADTGVENKNKNQSQSIQQTGADAGSGVSENQALQQRDGEEIDLLDSDEDALDQVAANFDHSKQDNVSDEQKKQQKQQQEKKEQAVSQHHIHQLHQPNEPSEPSQPEEEIDLLDSDEDALNEVTANFNY